MLVDDQDFDRVMQFKWQIHKGPRDTTWYVYGNAKNNNGYSKLHRFIMGVTDPKIKVDHIDGDGLNNQRSNNLRLVNPQQSSTNTKVHADNGNGFKGVSFHKPMGKFWARIMRKGKEYDLGFFNTAIEASIAYEAKAKELG